MTCIVGVADEHRGITYIGGDAAAVAGHTLTLVTPKVWRRHGWVFGGTTSFRMMDILRHSLDIDYELDRNTEGGELLRFMQTSFVDAVREVLKAGGFMKVENGVEQGGSWLAGYRGRLFHIDSDQQVTESLHGYFAVGSGDDTALGALYALKILEEEAYLDLPGPAKITAALSAAAAHITTVSPPFTVLGSDGLSETYELE